MNGPMPLANRLALNLNDISEAVTQIVTVLAEHPINEEILDACRAILDRCQDLELVVEDVAALKTPESPDYLAGLADQDDRAAREAWRGRPWA